jgi:hypothetical protein
MVSPVHAIRSGISHDTGNEPPNQSPPVIGIGLSMYRGFSLGSCSFVPPINPNIAPGDTNFPANTPFHVRHGWIASGFTTAFNQTDQNAFMSPQTTFELYVDGVQTHALHDYSLQNGDFVKLFLTNFGTGMTGAHVFVGWWFIDAHLNGDGPYGGQDLALACALRVHFQ